MNQEPFGWLVEIASIFVYKDGIKGSKFLLRLSHKSLLKKAWESEIKQLGKRKISLHVHVEYNKKKCKEYVWIEQPTIHQRHSCQKSLQNVKWVLANTREEVLSIYTLLRASRWWNVSHHDLGTLKCIGYGNMAEIASVFDSKLIAL